MSTRFAVAAVALSTLTASVAHADRSVAYCIPQGNPPVLRVFDLADPSQFRSIPLSSSLNAIPGGLDFDDTGTLFATDWSQYVYRINPTTGATNTLPRRFETYSSFGKDLSWDPSTQNLIGMRYGSLPNQPMATNMYYAIDRSSGEGRLLGFITGIPNPGGTVAAVLGLAIERSGRCILSPLTNQRLFVTDSISDFSATQLTAFTGANTTPEGLGCDWTRSGRVYGVDYQGQLRLVNPDGSTTLMATLGGGYVDIAIDPLCAADFNRDRTVDFFDYLDFVAAFSGSSATADFDFSGTLDLFDYLDFVGHFAQGC
ncbi:MAG: hypothetical protein KGS45_09305 [Planctomycetes bacterium]|nr:hypothetical protein [Planctomycetota bacterium]